MGNKFAFVDGYLFHFTILNLKRLSGSIIYRKYFHDSLQGSMNKVKCGQYVLLVTFSLFTLSFSVGESKTEILEYRIRGM